MQALGDIITIINPELAICTGDNIIGFSKTTKIPKSYSDRWDAFWDGTTPSGLGGMNNTRVPIFIITGNNDYDKFRFILPKGKYTIDKGTLMQSFNNETISVYDVKIPVEASSSVSVTIRPDHTKGVASQKSDIITLGKPDRLTFPDR